MRVSVTDAYPRADHGAPRDLGFSLCGGASRPGSAPEPAASVSCAFRGAPAPVPAPPPALEHAFRDTATFLAANRIAMNQVVDAAAVELGGTYALEDGVDLSGAFYEYLERPGVAETHPRIEDALAVAAEESLDLAPETAQQLACDLLAIARSLAR